MVDSQLKVYGVNGLRVVDASIFPLIPDANIQVSRLSTNMFVCRLTAIGHGVYGRREGCGLYQAGLVFVEMTIRWSSSAVSSICLRPFRMRAGKKAFARTDSARSATARQGQRGMCQSAGSRERFFTILTALTGLVGPTFSFIKQATNGRMHDVE